MKKTSLKLNILYSSFYQFFLVITPLITAPYLSRALGANGIGIFSYTNSYQVFFALFAALGTVSYGTREISRNRDNEVERTRLFWEIEIITVFTTLICLALWIAFSLAYREYRIIFLLFTFNILAVAFDISWFYAGMELFKYSVFLNTLIKTCGIICLFLFVKQKSDVPVYVAVSSLTTLAANVSMWIFLPKFLRKISVSALKPFSHIKEIWVYFVPTIATSVYTILDKSLIGLITNDEFENGYYEQATKVIYALQAVTFYSVNNVFSSRNAFLFSENKQDEIKSAICSTMNYIFFMGVGICFGLIGISGRFVPLFFGDGYEKTIFLTNIFAPIVLIVGISNCLGGQYYTPSGKRAQSAKFIVAGAVTNLLLNLCLIPFWGSKGAVVASVIAEFLISALYIAFCKGYYSFGLLFSQLWKKIIAGMLMLAVITIIDGYIESAVGALLIEVAAGAFVYVLLLVALRDSFVFNVADTLKKRVRGNELTD